MVQATISKLGRGAKLVGGGAPEQGTKYGYDGKCRVLTTAYIDGSVWILILGG